MTERRSSRSDMNSQCSRMYRSATVCVTISTPCCVYVACVGPVFMKNSVHIPVTLPASHADDFRSISLFSPIVGMWFQVGHDVLLPSHCEHFLTCLFNYAVQTATLSYVSTKFSDMW